MSKKQVVRITKLYLKQVKEAGIPIKEAYLFGSQLTEKTHKGSDIDVCIVSPIFGKDRQKERIILMNIRDNNTLTIEPHPVSPKDLQSKFLPLSSQIMKTGQKISL